MSAPQTTGEQHSLLTATRGEEDSQSVTPDRIGRYPIVERIGSGGMGRVYMGIDVSLGRSVAIKVLRATVEESKALVLREAQSLAKLSHENVIAVYEVGIDAGFVFIAMEYVEGEHLGQWLGGPVSDDDILDAFIQAGRGLAAAHAQGIVHRDFKLSNAMIDGTGRVRVLDFGVAQLEHEGTVEQSQLLPVRGAQTGPGVFGTPIYMAPEQHAGESVTQAADQFSFCVALWRALYDAYPFVGTGESLVRAKRQGELTAPTRRISRQVHAALVRGLACDPRDRFANMQELLHELAVPAPSRLGLLAPLAVVVALLAVAAWPEAEPTGCLEGDARVREVWNEARKQEIAAAFAGAPASYATATWTRAAAQLDTYADAWAEAHHEVCAAADAELDARMACLSGDLEQLRALLDVMTEADPSAVESAVEAVGKLEPPSRCVAAPVDGSAVADDVPPDVAARVLAEVRRARATLDGGRLEDALAQARVAARQAAEIGAPGLDLEVQALLGACLDAMGRFDEAVAALETAFFIAREREPPRALRLALRLVQTHANAGRHDDAAAWLRHAEAQFERVAPGPELEHELFTARGEVLVAAHDYEGAKVEFERAADFARQQLRDSDEALAGSLHNVGVMHAELGDWKKAREAYEQALDIRREFLGPDHPKVADSLSNLANTYIYSGDYNEALERLEDAYERTVAARGRSHEHLPGILSNLAVALFRLGRMEDARARLAEALAISKDVLPPDHPHIVTLTANLAAVNKQLGRIEEATRHFEHVVALVEASHGARARQLIEPLITLGNLLCDEGQFDAGLGRYRRAQEISEAVLGESHGLTAHARLATAVALHGMGKAAEAAEILEGVVVARDAPGFTPAERAEVRFHLGRALWDAGTDRPRARRLVAEAQALIATAEDAVDELRDGIDAWARAH